MSAHGNLVLIFGIFAFYSFIGWGIAELYNEGYTPLEPDKFISIGGGDEGDCYTEGCSGWSEYLPGGGKDPFYGIGRFFSKLITSIGYSFEVLTYTNEHIPFLVNLLIITPLNLMMIGAGIFLLRGGGS